VHQVGFCAPSAQTPFIYIYSRLPLGVDKYFEHQAIPLGAIYILNVPAKYRLTVNRKIFITSIN
jgi:hypothetical protein